MSNIMIGSYNNYYNRIVKSHNYSEILTAGRNWMTFTKINFNPNDGVNTTLILNFNPLEAGYGNFEPDYLVVLSDNNTISQRWFVLDIQRTRQGQINLTLRRDLLADYKSDVLDAVTFLEKGYVTTDNPLIFNKENCKFNQIKKTEIEISDDTRAGWVVGYLAPNIGTTTDEEGVVVAKDTVVEISYPQEDIPDISTFEYIDYVGGTVVGNINVDTSYIVIGWSNNGVSYTPVVKYLNGTGEVDIQRGITFSHILVNNKSAAILSEDIFDFNIPLFETVISTNTNYNDIFSLQNKVYRDGDTYKKVVLSAVNEHNLNTTISNAEYPAVIQSVKDILSENGYTLYNGAGYANDRIGLYLEYGTYLLSLVEVGSPMTKAKITLKNTSKSLEDAPYKMFCIPLREGNTLEVDGTIVPISKNRTLQIASSLAMGLKGGTDGFLYDIQLLPYCPISDKFVTNMYDLIYLGGREGIDYDVMYNNDIPAGYIFYCTKSSFTLNIHRNHSSLYPPLHTNSPIDFKVNSETYKFRIVSPNYANFDEFNYYMNYGIDYYNIDCTYKPITPYIKININYKGLYGQDFNDNRGLILGGDFSLPILNDAWVNYQIQNKNYSNIFERGTQHLEYNRQWDVANEVTGVISGTANAAIMGGAVGGIGGAIGAGVTSLAAGAVDLIASEGKYNESMDYRKDLFNMQLQNIQALPQGLVKTSAFNYNSRIWPFIEIYKSTDVEAEAFKNKIKYTGMTLGVIGSIKDYLNPTDLTYIQGKLIRITSILEDTHIVSEINKELNMGVYL